MEIELAQLGDIPEVAELCLKGAKEFSFAKLPVPEPLMVRNWIAEQWMKAPLFIVRHEGKIVGFLGSYLLKFWWNHEGVVLSDYRIYVQPEHRSLRLTAQFYEKLKQFADHHGLPVHITQYAEGRLDARRRLMRRLGFKETGFTAVYEGKNE